MNQFIVIVAMSLITIVAYFSKGILGFGEGLITVSLFLLFLDPKLVFPITLLLAVIGGLYQFFYIKRDIDGRVIKIMFIPVILGVIMGTYLFNILDAKIVKTIFAVFLILYSLRLLLNSKTIQDITQKQLRISKLLASGVGLISGVIDGIMGVGGVPVIIYLNHIGFKKNKFRATIVSIFLILGISRIITYTYSGLIDFNIVKQVAYLTPAVIIGTFLGIKVCPLINDALFRKIVIIALIIIGLLLLVRN